MVQSVSHQTGSSSYLYVGTIRIPEKVHSLSRTAMAVVSGIWLSKKLRSVSHPYFSLVHPGHPTENWWLRPSHCSVGAVKLSGFQLLTEVKENSRLSRGSLLAGFTGYLTCPEYW